MLWHVLSPRRKRCQIRYATCTFYYPGRFCHHVVTNCAKRFTCCMICLSFASTIIICFPIPMMCVCVCVCVCAYFMHMCVYVERERGKEWAHVHVSECVCCVLLSMRQSVLNWNSVLLWVDYKAAAACSSVSCVEYDYKETERPCVAYSP